MRILHPADYRVMAWRNGGGVTTQLYVSPREAPDGNPPFDWRVSIADVSGDGPFSPFPGYDRHIMAIAGNGMTLKIDGQPDIVLDVLYRPNSFDGDWQVYGRPKSGPVRDFNLMVRREYGRGKLNAIRGSHVEIAVPQDGTELFMYVVDGTASVGEKRLEQGTSLYVAGTPPGPLRLDGLAICCEIKRPSPFRDS